jgi:hypothetical protein
LRSGSRASRFSRATLHFAPKASRLAPLGETKYVERVEKTPKKNAQAQVQKVAPAPKIPSP